MRGKLCDEWTTSVALHGSFNTFQSWCSLFKAEAVRTHVITPSLATEVASLKSGFFLSHSFFSVLSFITFFVGVSEFVHTCLLAQLWCSDLPSVAEAKARASSVDEFVQVASTLTSDYFNAELRKNLQSDGDSKKERPSTTPGGENALEDDIIDDPGSFDNQCCFVGFFCFSHHLCLLCLYRFDW
jgi:hypothetical protein